MEKVMGIHKYFTGQLFQLVWIKTWQNQLKNFTISISKWFFIYGWGQGIFTGLGVYLHDQNLFFFNQKATLNYKWNSGKILGFIIFCWRLSSLKPCLYSCTSGFCALPYKTFCSQLSIVLLLPWIFTPLHAIFFNLVEL